MIKIIAKNIVLIAIGLSLQQPLLSQQSDKSPREDTPDRNPIVAHYVQKAENFRGQKEYKKALKYYRKVEKHAENLRNKGIAVISQGQCFIEMGKSWRAFSEFKRAVDKYSEHIPYLEVLQVEFDIANAMRLKERERFLFFSFTTYGKAIDIYQHIVQNAPHGPFTVDAIYNEGLLYLELKDYESATFQFNQIIKKYSTSSFVVDAKIDLARSLLYSAKEADADGTLGKRALSILQRIVDRYPDHTRIEEANELLGKALNLEASRLMYLAIFYHQESHRRDAASIRYLREITANYGGSAVEENAKELLHSIEISSKLE